MSVCTSRPNSRLHPNAGESPESQPTSCSFWAFRCKVLTHTLALDLIFASILIFAIYQLATL